MNKSFFLVKSITAIKCICVNLAVVWFDFRFQNLIMVLSNC